MNREEKNQMIRDGLVDVFASTKLSKQLLEKHARFLDGLPQTPLDDLFHAAKVAGLDLTAAAPEPCSTGLYVDTEIALKLILSIGLLRTPQRKLSTATSNWEREERDRVVRAHRDALVLSNNAKSADFSLEAFHQELSTLDSPELVTRMLLSPSASSRIVTADNKALDPIHLPTKKLNSDSVHRVRIEVVEVSQNGTSAMVKITWAGQPDAVALKNLFKRSVRLEYRRFKGIANIADLLLSLRLARRQAELMVTVTRSLRPTDKDLDLLVLKEFCGLKELAAAVPGEVQRIQEDLWSSLR